MTDLTFVDVGKEVWSECVLILFDMKIMMINYLLYNSNSSLCVNFSDSFSQTGSNFLTGTVPTELNTLVNLESLYICKC